MTTPDFSDEPTTEFDFGDALKNDAAPVFDKPQRPKWGVGPKKTATPPAKKAPAARGRKPKVDVPPSKKGEFVDDITMFYTTIGMGVALKDQQCGTAIVQSAPGIAEAWDKLAESNPAVRKALRTLTKSTAIGAVIAAHAPVLMAIGAHHGFGFGPRDRDEETVEAA